jgi:hypothetical protein
MLEALRFPKMSACTQENAGDKKPDVKLIEATNTEAMTMFENTFKVNETANSIKYEISRCPQYDGLKAAGFNHEQIRKMC